MSYYESTRDAQKNYAQLRHILNTRGWISGGYIYFQDEQHGRVINGNGIWNVFTLMEHMSMSSEFMSTSSEFLGLGKYYGGMNVIYLYASKRNEQNKY